MQADAESRAALRAAVLAPRTAPTIAAAAYSAVRSELAAWEWRLRRAVVRFGSLGSIAVSCRGFAATRRGGKVSAVERERVAQARGCGSTGEAPHVHRSGPRPQKPTVHCGGRPSSRVVASALALAGDAPAPSAPAGR
ncbi:hypothetical protein GCM10023082_30520 [Streptomyces tremellae]|uniref:Uncharacterized protein n=1 Tax=Streptomyces tremellae TaxID=1124239 RepID=A0ABP7F5N0_9ACTN